MQHFQPPLTIIPNTQVILQDFLTTARKRSLGQGNVLTPVCHSVHGEVEHVSQVT